MTRWIILLVQLVPGPLFLLTVIIISPMAIVVEIVVAIERRSVVVIIYWRKWSNHDMGWRRHNNRRSYDNWGDKGF